MGIIWNKNAPIKEIHSAYGIKLKGRVMGYESIWSPEITHIITELWVNERFIDLGNAHSIFAEDKTGRFLNMEKDKDDLCYWLAKNEMDDWELEQFFSKQYTSSLWRCRVRQMKMRERIGAA